MKLCKKSFNTLLRRLSLFATIKRRCSFILDNPLSSITETVHKFKIWTFSNEDQPDKRFAFLKLIPSVAASYKIELGMSKILRGYLQESTSFDETKSNLSTYFARAGLEGLNEESLLSFEEKLQSLGFFCNSLDMHNACFNLVKGVRADATIKSKGWDATYRDFLWNMYRGRIQNANNSLEELHSSRGSNEPFRRTVIRELDHYIFLASNGKYGSRIEIKDDKFAELIRGKELLIVGPGNGPPIDFTLIPSDTLVVRMLKPGLLNWSSEYSNGNRLSEIGYVSGETAVYLEAQSDTGWSNEFESLCFRSSSNFSSSLDQGRQLVTNNHLLRRGAPQMLLYAIWDLSIFKPRSIKITNVDFYSTKTPLRLNSRRIFKQIDGSERQVSSSGSAGMPFDRCRTHALHGTVHNRNVMKMIFRNEIFHLSHETKAAIEYSDEDYCARLEDAIGRMRI